MKSFISLLLILILKLNSCFVDNIEFEKLLGKHLYDVKKVIDVDFKKNNFEKVKIGFYSNKEYLNISYFGMISHHITLLSNDKEMVTSISVHFRKIIDRPFYDSFVREYGSPSSIQIIKKRQIESEIVLKNDSSKVDQTLRKGTVDLSEGSFEDKPLFIIWKKESYQIKAFLRHEQNISEIIFSIPEDRF